MKTSRVLGQLAITSFVVTVACFTSASVQASTIPYQAATAPATKCVTAKTQATHANVQALLKKDTQPYLEKAAYAKAIQTYTDGINTAWAAMQEPYCGFGTYGTASAVKSYSKSTVRARDAFLTEVKRIKAGGEKVDTSTPVVTPTKIEEPEPVVNVVVPTTTNTPTPTAKTASVTTSVKSIKILSGLTQGMRSDSISELQRRLAKALKTSADSDHITGYFGPTTKNLLIQYQIQKKIITSKTSPGAGQVGPRTAAALNAE